MKKIMIVIALLVCSAVPSLAQSNNAIPGIFNINAGGEIFEVTGSEFIMTMTNLAEENFLLTLKLDQLVFAEKLEMSWEESLELEWKPMEKNNDTKSSQTVKWDRKAGYVAVDSKDKTTVVEYDDGETSIVIYMDEDGPVIIVDKKTGESL